jgi:hypothetical protein
MFWLASLQAMGASISLSSPDKAREIVISLTDEGVLSYRVNLHVKPVLRDSPLGLKTSTHDFTRGLKLITSGKVETRRERYELFAGIMPRMDRVLNHRSVEFHNQDGASMMVDLAASDEGVAFRHRFTSSSGAPTHIMEERTGFHLPQDARAWLQPLHAAGKYTPAYEDFYFQVSPGDPPPHSREKPIGWAFPALFRIPSADAWILITEVSSLDPYPACHLAPDSKDSIYRIAFPRKNERDLEKGADEPEPPHHRFPWTLPWRAVLLAEDAAEIATSTLVTDLAPPSRLTDVSWIKPGRASWAWWSFPEGPFDAEVFHRFTNFSADLGWEYTLFDANWWDPGIEPLVRQATGRKVGAMMWTHARDYETPAKRRSKLDEVAGYGAVGVKADFWCSDRQETIGCMQSLFEDAAKRKLLVNLHGCTLPRGWHRTWPNFITAEAVLGAESYLYESKFTAKAAELNTVLPFTRNVVGPMDYTPFALSPKRYARTTTAAHELANSIICTSGIIHYADSPEIYQSLPEDVVNVLRDAPARWDETRCLTADPGRIAIFARRSGTRWFIAGISGSEEAQSFTLDLAAFAMHPRRTLIQEGDDAVMKLISKSISTAPHFQHSIPPRGGFVLRLDH